MAFRPILLLFVSSCLAWAQSMITLMIYHGISLDFLGWISGASEFEILGRGWVDSSPSLIFKLCIQHCAIVVLATYYILSYRNLKDKRT
ncbi:hypothetical protein BDV18DRAFT_149485 [Aspergillus unguis]